jgi:serine phosphatase RsbU (regulator of sigma subunit)
MIKLVGTDGERYYSWALEPGKHTIGRLVSGGSNCEFVIEDKTVSRRHAEIEVTADGVFLSDFGSHNGTFVNGARISGRVRVAEGDSVMFGQAEFTLSPADGTHIPPVGSTVTKLADADLKNSVFLSIDEALKPLPTKVTEQPLLLPTLFEMAKMLVLPEPKEEMLKRSLGMISRVIPAERLAVLFVSEDQTEVYTVATLLTGKQDPGAFTLSRTIVGEIITNKNAIVIGDPKNDPRFAEKKSIILSELKSAVAVPLFDEGKVLGILYADTTRPYERYDDEHLRVLAAFGNIIASRLLNYELLTERQEKQIMEAELRRASAIQKSLLVTEPPEIEGYRIFAFQEQSRSVGGDLYDLKILPDGRMLFMVADVSGKGMGAALLMSNILASFRILYESDDFDLCSAVKRVSLHLNNYSRSGEFATLFVGLAEPRTGKIKYVNAGHNPPVLARTDGRIEHLAATGFMIGAFPFGDWGEQNVDLGAGDVLAAFTDGVTEAQRRDLEQYGDDRLEKMIIDRRDMNPQEITEQIISDVNQFIGDAPRSDDITTLLLKRV